jgi:hypothetical protein
MWSQYDDYPEEDVERSMTGLVFDVYQHEAEQEAEHLVPEVQHASARDQRTMPHP